MKQIMLFCLAGLLSSNLSAQDIIETSIYFESGKHELTTEAKEALNQFITQSQNWTDFDLDIKAYTDDVGNEDYNIELAGNRATSVKTYLEGADVVATTSEIAGLGEIALINDLNVDAQRQENRRVDISLSPFAPENLTDLYDYFGKRNTQKFQITAGRDTTLIGNKGTIIFIPSQSLCLANGVPVDEQTVVIELREAYSYQDILLENLTTTSGNQLIETDGMIHMNVQTIDGQEVFVREGEEVTISMPSERENIDGMELFYADRPLATPAANIDWQAPGVPFQRNNFNNSEYIQEVMFPFGNLAAIQPFEAIEVFEIPDLSQTAPQAPQCPRAPKFTLKEPTMESTTNRYSKRKKESQEAYEARLVTLYERDLNVYTINKDTYEKNIVKYQNDSSQYVLDYAQYQADLADYNANRDGFDQWMLDNKDSIYNWLETFEWAKTALDQRLVGAIRGAGKIDDYRKYLIQEAQIVGMNDVIPQIQEFELEEATDTLKKVAIAFVNCIRNGRKLCATKVDGSIKMIRNYYTGLSKKPITSNDLQICFEDLNQDVPFFAGLINNYNETLEKSNFCGYAASLYEKTQPLLEIQGDIIVERERKALEIALENPNDPRSKAIINDAYMNTIGIDQFGWVNCDRFRNVSEDQKQHILVLDEQNVINNDTKYMTFCKDTRVVTSLNLEYGSQGVYKTGYSGLPVNEEVVVIGLRIADGKVEVFKQEGKVYDIQQITNPNFEVASLDDVRNLLGT